MNQGQHILISVLAATDALWTPNRSHWAAVYERRVLFRRAGVVWQRRFADDGDSDDTRRGVARRFHVMKIQRLIKSHNPTGGRSTHVRLTHAGDEHARALVGLPSLSDARALLAQLVELRDDRRAADFLGRRWLPETLLADEPVEWGDERQKELLADVELRLLPALVRGLVESNCSIKRHCWYRLTSDGEVFIANTKASSVALPDALPDGFDLYRDAIALARQELASAEKLDQQEIGEIPMPVSAVRIGGHPPQATETQA